MTQHESLRQTILQQTDLVGTKRRFGLFSQPISTAIGDDGAYKTVVHPKNEQGKPVTQLRNIFVSPTKSGQLNKSYFGPLNPLATSDKKDIFLEQGKRLIKEQYISFSKGKKQTSFFPIAGIKPITNSPYQFVHQKNPQLNPKRFRNDDGRVRSQPRNFYSNPQSKVIDTTFKSYNHMPDPYQRKHSIEVEQQKKQKAKEHESSFRPNSFSPQLMNKHRQVYGQDVELKPHQQKPIKLNIYPHENPWKSSNPNKHGLYGSLAPFPKYIESPPLKSENKSIQKSEKEAFKNMSSMLTSPTPSIAFSKVNIMRCVNRSFSHNH